MDEVYSILTERALTLLDSNKDRRGKRKRIIVSLSGPPGSGKSTIAARVVAHINTHSHSHTHYSQSQSQDRNQEPHDLASAIAIAIPMDGFHYPKTYLDTLPNRDEAYARRGAHWTFDAEGVLGLICELRLVATASTSTSASASASAPPDRDTDTDTDTNTTRTIYAPGFDHAIGDPVADAICIPPDTSFIIIEGNYLAFGLAPWDEVRELVDESWFVDVEPEVAKRRIARRHVESGIEGDYEAAVRRAEGNDLPNGVVIRERRRGVDVTVFSVDEWNEYPSLVL